MSFRRYALAAAVSLFAIASAAEAAELRFGIADDPDALDPVLNRSQVGVYVFGALCERLVNVNQAMEYEEGLAKSWTWSDDGKTLTLDLQPDVKFHDGTPFDAAAVKYNIDRSITMPTSQRKDDASSITSVEVLGPLKVAIHLKEPSAVLMSKLADRLGMMISPKAAQELGENFGRAPVCTGPYKFVERVAQDRIVLDKDPTFRNASDYSFDRITFRVIPDDAVRLANLQAGGLDIMDKLDPSAASTVSGDATLQVYPVNTLNYQSIVINMRGKNAENPMAKDPRVREAFSLALDRQAFVDVAFAGQYVAGNQFAPPASAYYNPDFPVPARDAEKAKKILADAGYTAPIPFELLVPNRPLVVRVAEMMQSMVNEAGFDLKLNVVDFATTLNLTDAGDFQAWGPIGAQFANDPDAITYMSLNSAGGRNVGKYSNPEMDKIMDGTRAAIDPEKRRDLFRDAAALILKDNAVIYLYHQRPLFAASSKLKNISTTGDGFILFDGLKLE